MGGGHSVAARPRPGAIHIIPTAEATLAPRDAVMMGFARAQPILRNFEYCRP
jgi:hypothetical protein